MSFSQKIYRLLGRRAEESNQTEVSALQETAPSDSRRAQIASSVRIQAATVSQDVETLQGKLSIQQLKNESNGFSEEKLDALMDLIEQWTKGTRRNLIYYYLLQHGYELEEGVDYSSNPSVNLPSLGKAQEQAREEWASQPEVQKWREDANNLVRELHAFYKKNPEIKVARSKPNHYRYLVNKTSANSTNSIFFDRGWVYIEGIPNSREDIIATNRKRPSESIKYKVYLSCPYASIYTVMKELTTRLGRDPILQQTGFHLKARDGSSRQVLPSLAENMNRLDSIVLYLGENGADATLPILQQLAEEKPQLFKQEGVLFAQPISTKTGSEIPGIRIAEEIGDAQQQSYNQIQAEIITKAIGNPNREAVAKVFRNPKRKAEFREYFKQNYLHLAEEAGLSTQNLAFGKIG